MKTSALIKALLSTVFLIVGLNKASACVAPHQDGAAKTVTTVMNDPFPGNTPCYIANN